LGLSARWNAAVAGPNDQEDIIAQLHSNRLGSGIKISCVAARTSCKTFTSGLTHGKPSTFHFYPHKLLITLWIKAGNACFHSGGAKIRKRASLSRKKITAFNSMTYQKNAGDTLRTATN
jgi:hypothetical protein